MKPPRRRPRSAATKLAVVREPGPGEQTADSRDPSALRRRSAAGSPSVKDASQLPSIPMSFPRQPAAERATPEHAPAATASTRGARGCDPWRIHLMRVGMLRAVRDIATPGNTRLRRNAP